MRYAGFPILGDPVYGNPTFNKKWNLDRQLLHAYHLSFTHPHTQQMLTVTAPIPADILRFITHLTQKSLNGQAS
jgi:23S rRNA pseudouridine1911/1915/1917 synthase